MSFYLSTSTSTSTNRGAQDVLHQPDRGAKVYPHMAPMIEAAVAAGASAAYLSGAGPTIMAITSGAR